MLLKFDENAISYEWDRAGSGSDGGDVAKVAALILFLLNLEKFA